MRKGISLLLMLALALTSFTTAFAVEPETPGVPADVQGTAYEAAVKALMDKGIISGYPDGTFRPEGTITRAEACVVIVQAMMASEKDLNDAAKKDFPDLAGYDWAAKYINYAAAKGAITGYPSGNFGPAWHVTYAEMASMLVRAMGYGPEDVTGVWPDNYISKAVELGLLEDVDYSAHAPALRGHVALMTYEAADDIEEANKPEEDEVKDPEEPGDKDQDDPAGHLADFSGRAYGILLDVAKVMNDKGDAVDEYEFLIGSKALFLKTNGKVTADSKDEIEKHFEEGNLYGLRMSNGVVTGFDTSDNDFVGINAGNFENFEIEGWAEVKSVSNYVIKTEDTFDDRDTFTVLDDASIYKAIEKDGKITGYERGTIRDVREGRHVRLYSVTGKEPGVVEIVLVTTVAP